MLRRWRPVRRSLQVVQLGQSHHGSFNVRCLSVGGNGSASLEATLLQTAASVMVCVVVQRYWHLHCSASDRVSYIVVLLIGLLWMANLHGLHL